MPAGDTLVSSYGERISEKWRRQPKGQKRCNVADHTMPSQNQISNSGKLTDP